MSFSSKLNIVSDSVSSGSKCGTGLHVQDVSQLVSSNLENNNSASGNVAFVTLGCSKNTVDSEVMMGVLHKKGYVAVQDLDQADLIVVNTCAFLESAVQEGIDTILEVSKYKEEGRCKKLVVAGCMVERYREDLAKSLPEVDRFISTDQLMEVGEDEDVNNKALNSERKPYFLYDDLSPRILSTPSHTAYVKIAEGCDRPCAFCIIPKIRGAFRSRSIKSISNEVQSLVTQGVKEINFVAQDLTSYGSDFPGNRGIKNELVSLINSVEELDPNYDFWLRLFYAYPIGVQEDLIRLIETSPRVCNYLDMPLQHISNNVLKSMRRPLGEKGTRNLIEQIRSVGPKIKLRTTFVVGFPGETDEDIDALEKYISEGHFMHVGIFTYSQEKEAASYVFDNQVEDHIKDERRARLMIAQANSLEKQLNQLIGTKQRVLLEGTHEDSDLLLIGRTEWQGPEADGITIINEVGDKYMIEVEDERGNLVNDFAPEIHNLKGQFLDVEITEVAGYDVVASLI